MCAVRFVISAIASGALGIQKKVVKKNSQKAFDGTDDLCVVTTLTFA